MRLTDEEKAQVEKMLEDAIDGYRDHLHPDAIAHVQADFSQMLDYWGQTGGAELFPAFAVGDRVVWHGGMPVECGCEHGAIAEVVPQPDGENLYRVVWDYNHGRWNGLHPTRMLRPERP